jgi:hypothetical protein
MISHIGRGGGGGLVPLHHVVDPLLRPRSPPASARYLMRFATEIYPIVLTPAGVFTSVATPAEYCNVRTIAGDIVCVRPDSSVVCSVCKVTGR